ncbi:DUF4402 domain-containing protein [Phenylobacterium sp.]|jgi:hypothetical protein|uniref:DUF4402 domain-containing protein n=1 Tax=Phenylobacterium sp. TaxID=1871053 RepID=UPI002F92E0F6
MNTRQKILLAAVSAAALSATASAANAQATSTATATASVTLLAPIAIVKDADLVFGKVAKAVGTATIAPGGGLSNSTNGPVFVGTGQSAAAFHVTGENGATIAWTAPTTATVTGLTNPVALTYSWGGTAPTTLVTDGDSDFDFTVGGTIDIVLADTTSTTAKTGTFTVEVHYN